MTKEQRREEDSTNVTEVVRPLGEPGLKICVFCSANDLPEKYTEPAKKLARLIAEHGHTFIWGGSDSGLMREVSSSAQEAGGRIVGVSVEYLKHVAKHGADEMVIAKDLGERKALMLERADAVVMMVGGIGTIDEATDIIEHRKHGHHDKPIVVMNTEGFYEGLQIQLERMDTDGFLPRPLGLLVQFANTPEETLVLIEQALS